MKKKVLLTTFIAAIVAVSMSFGAFAATGMQQITAYLNKGINLSLNGKAWQPKDAAGNVTYPITYNSTTYLPVRAVAEALGIEIGWDGSTNTVRIGASSASFSPAAGTAAYDTVLKFPADKYPETAAHIAAAIKSGKSAICTIDRDGADENREESLAGIPTKEGYDRDEWPMAMCKEGGTGADVAYIEPGDNRGAGSWVSNQLEDYPDGTRVLFVIDGTPNAGIKEATPETTTPKTTDYTSCKEAKAAGAAPLHRGDPGYSLKLDRDGDGVACE